MTRIPRQLRFQIARQFAHCCAMCSRPFLSFDLHHIKFASLGGSNAEANLIPLCQVCHAVFAHKLSKAFTPDMLAKLRRQRLELSKREQSIRSNIGSDPAKACASLLMDSTRQLVLLFGRYHRFLILAERLADELPGATASDRCLKARVVLFAGEMALYCDQEPRVTSRVQRATKALERSKELAGAHASAALVLSRLLGRIGSPREEASMLAISEPDAADNSLGRREWVFRKVAFLKKRREYEKALELADSIAPSAGVALNPTAINVLSEVARVHLDTGQPLEARNIFKTVLQASTSEHHRRGILVTSIFLARANLTLRDFDKALHNLVLASNCIDVARSKERLDLDVIRFELEDAVGPAELLKLEDKRLGG